MKARIYVEVVCNQNFCVQYLEHGGPLLGMSTGRGTHQFSSVHFDLITQEMLHLHYIGGFHAGPGPH